VKPLELGKVYEGRTFKLGFSPIPSQDPISLERMWVRVTCVLKGGVIHGALANDPELFKKKTLKADDTVVFALKHVLDVIPDTKKAAKAAARSAEVAKKAAKEKLAAKKLAAKKTAAKKKSAKKPGRKKTRRSG
jgi:uncharacterized FlgJ-related protein